MALKMAANSNSLKHSHRLHYLNDVFFFLQLSHPSGVRKWIRRFSFKDAHLQPTAPLPAPEKGTERNEK
jgi:hypothetical protein